MRSVLKLLRVRPGGLRLQHGAVTRKPILPNLSPPHSISYFSTSPSDNLTGSSIISPEYAFEMAASNIRFGRGVTKEIGQDLVSMGLTRKVCVVTDPHMATLPPMQAVTESLTKAGVEFEVFDSVTVRILL